MVKDWKGDWKSVALCLGVEHSMTQPNREENDFYATEPKAATLLMGIEDLHKNIWECACGEGHLAKVFEAAGHNVKATDLIYRGYGEGGVDFLKQAEPFDGDIITNPPYRYALEFCKHGIKLLKEGCKLCMFLKIQYLEGKERRKFYDVTPPARVWVSSSRLKCGRGGVFSDSAVAYAWFVWEKDFHGITELKWFN